MGFADVKIQMMTSWTRSSPHADGTMGGGIAFTQPNGCVFRENGNVQAHVPAPGVRCHTHALLMCVNYVLRNIPTDVSVEIELTSNLIVETFKRYANATEFISFLRETLTNQDFVPAAVIDELEQLWVSRPKPVTFKLCLDAGRYMTKETSGFWPPGVAGSKRLEAARNGDYCLMRAPAGNNTDLLETRFIGFLRPREFAVLQDRFRDITLLEMNELKRWAGKLDQKLFSLENLADNDPGVFWSCLRYGGDLIGDNYTIQKNRDEVIKATDQMATEQGHSTTWDFPGANYLDISIFSLLHLLTTAVPKYQASAEFAGIRSHEGDKGSQFEDQLMKMLNPSEAGRAKLNRQMERNEQRQGGPNVNTGLFGQCVSCFGCGNVECPRTPFFACPACKKAHFCHQCIAWEDAVLEHKLECPNAVSEPEAEHFEEKTEYVECVVLPGDDRVKPYTRWLPKDSTLAINRLKTLLARGLGSNKDHTRHGMRFLCSPPERGFMNGMSDAGIAQAGVTLIQADFTSPFDQRDVEIHGLESAAGRTLNGLVGRCGAYDHLKCRYSVEIPAGSKSIKGENLRLHGEKPNIPPQNKRASTILTKLNIDPVMAMNAMRNGTLNPETMDVPNKVCTTPHPNPNGVEPVLGIRARGDVIVVRLQDGENLDAEGVTLQPFKFSEFEDLWGIFQWMPLPDMPWASGILMKLSRENEQTLGGIMRQFFFGDEVESDAGSDNEPWWELETGEGRDEGDDEPDPLVGSYVEVFGLQKAAKYNGQIGYVQEYLPASSPDDEDRFEVNLVDAGTTLSIKRKNLMRRPKHLQNAQSLHQETEAEPDSEFHDEDIPRIERLARAPAGASFYVKPSDLMFWCSEIDNNLKSGKTILDTYKELSTNSSARKVERLKVTSHNGRLHALSGRRLALYRLLEHAGLLKRIKVKMVSAENVNKEKCFTGNGEIATVKGTSYKIGVDKQSTVFDF